MENYQKICDKLEAFIRKYYFNELLRGAILFFAVGLLYFLLLLFLEYFLWLNRTGRAILFWSFIVVEIGLFIKFIFIPIARLFKLSKGIDYTEASSMIGAHFPEVNDKLLNVLQLKNQHRDSELVLASIDQKAAELRPVPFNFAINLKKNLKYLKYAAAPILIIIIVFLLGKNDLFTNSYERIVHYEKTFTPPAPFHFFIGNSSLSTKQNSTFTLKIHVKGRLMPENVSIHFNDEVYFMKKRGPGIFQYKFEEINQSVEFYLSANKVQSRRYKIKMISVPTLLDFRMFMDYPAYTGKQDEIIKSTGNATFPEGTEIRWKLATQSTDKVQFHFPDTTLEFEQRENTFSFQQRFYQDVDYEISTSNAAVQDYEELSYALTAVKDEYPKLQLTAKLDSANQHTFYLHGQVSDDYGISKLEMVYYPVNSPQQKATVPIEISSSNFDEFVSVFPGKLPLKKGTSYAFFFRAYDNDGVHGPKKTKSRVYSFHKFSDAEKKHNLLNAQKQTFQKINRSLENFSKAEKKIDQFNRLQKQEQQILLSPGGNPRPVGNMLSCALSGSEQSRASDKS